MNIFDKIYYKRQKKYWNKKADMALESMKIQTKPWAILQEFSLYKEFKRHADEFNALLECGDIHIKYRRRVQENTK